MIRLHVIAEGPTETQFIKQIIAPYLAEFDIVTDARAVQTSRDRRKGKKYSGGIINYEKAKKDVSLWMKEDDASDCRFTTMFDLYALPTSFPQYKSAQEKHDPYESVDTLENTLKNDINNWRFLPYIQMHEFETLILADPQKLLLEYIGYESRISKLLDEIKGIDPELINSGVETAPSKRILKAIPGYDKVTAGNFILKQIGLDVLRSKCNHFNQWLTRLETLRAGESS